MAYSDIDKPSDYFETITYTGTGATGNSQTVGFQPDFIWFKNRSTGDDHALFDSVRGRTKILLSNGTNAEITGTTDLESFDSNGFTVGVPNQVSSPNRSGSSIVSWNWLAGGTASSNTDGSITSQVSASTTSGFSIVSYTGTGANATVGHGLGVAPAVVLVKDRTTAGYDWFMYHHKNTSEPATDYLRLNLTNATTDNVVVWNDTAPTSSVFSIGTSVGVNANTDEYIAYCFSEVKGFSKFGSYTGNGSTDGTFVYTGFKPAMIIWKNSSNAYNWVISDNKRNTFNDVDKYLLPNTSGAEGTLTLVDFLSNGFKIRTTDASINNSSDTIIYMCFAENPFTTSTGIPTTAR